MLGDFDDEALADRKWHRPFSSLILRLTNGEPQGAVRESRRSTIQRSLHMRALTRTPRQYLTAIIDSLEDQLSDELCSSSILSHLGQLRSYPDGNSPLGVAFRRMVRNPADPSFAMAVVDLLRVNGNGPDAGAATPQAISDTLTAARLLALMRCMRAIAVARPKQDHPAWSKHFPTLPDRPLLLPECLFVYPRCQEHARFILGRVAQQPFVLCEDSLEIMRRRAFHMTRMLEMRAARSDGGHRLS